MNQLQQLTAALNGFDLLVAIALRSAVLLAVAAVVMLLLRRPSAAVRHLGWAVAVTGVILMPLVSLVMPEWRVLPSRAPATLSESQEAGAPVVQATLTSSATVIEGSRQREPEIATQMPAPAEKPRVQLSRAEIALFAWLAGALLVLAVVALGFVRVAMITRKARRTTDGLVLSTIAEVSAQMKVGSVLILEAGDAAMPMTWGLLQPKLLLPAEARNWPQAKLRAVLRHELAHVRRRDSLWQLIAELVCALHWFNPLAWYAARQMRIEREHACDDEVLNGGSRASEYATELLDIARSLRSARATSLAAIAMAQPSQLEGRLLAVLDEKRARHAPMRRWPAWLAAVVVVGPIAGASSKVPSAKPQKEKNRVVAQSSRAAVAFTPPANVRVGKPEPRSAAMLQQAQEPCPGDDSSASINSNANDDRQEVKWEAGRCKGRLNIRGRIRLSGDLTAIESISSDGDFRLWLNDGRAIRVVTARPSGNAIVYEYTVDGNQRPWNPEGRAWFASAMTYVVRRTGFAADERVDYLLKQQGPSGVLAEVEQMKSDYVQRLYLQKLINKTQLNGTALESVLTTARRALQSDYEMAELLIAIANKSEFTEGVRRAFIDATTTLQSDYEHRRALSAVLKKGGLNSENVAAMLASSTAIDSDYEKAELLLSVVGKYKLDSNMRAAYLTSASKLDSDYERGRVLKALLTQGAASAGEAADVMEAVAAMSSDYERSEVMRLLPAASLANPEVQNAYLKAITRMRSDYEMRRSLTSIVESGRLTGGGLNMTLNAVAKMRSDYERAELLLAVIKAYRLNEAQRQSVIVAADQMKSEYERGRVSSALVRQLAAPPPPANRN